NIRSASSGSFPCSPPPEPTRRALSATFEPAENAMNHLLLAAAWLVRLALLVLFFPIRAMAATVEVALRLDRWASAIVKSDAASSLPPRPSPRRSEACLPDPVVCRQPGAEAGF